MPTLTLENHRAHLEGVLLRSGDLLEILVVPRRWIPGIFWSPGDHPIGPPGWHDGDGMAPCLRIPLAVPGEEEGAPGAEATPFGDGDGEFRRYVTLYLRESAVLRWLEPRRNLYLGPRS